MADNQGVFLPPSCKKWIISDETVRKAEMVICTTKTLFQKIGRPFYLVDLNDDKVIYTSEGLNLICGIKSDEMMAMGHDFFKKYASEYNMKRHDWIGEELFKYLHNNKDARGKDFQVDFNAHLRIDGKERLFRYTIFPVLFTDDGFPWLVMVMVSQPTNRSTRYITIRWQGEREYRMYDMDTYTWKKKEIPRLTEREKDILRLSSQGCTAQTIADEMCISVESVKMCKHVLFKKLDVSNITSAIVCCLNYNLI